MKMLIPSWLSFRADHVQEPAKPDAPRAAVVGVGHLGRFHAEKYAASREAYLEAVVDIDAERGERLAQRLRCSFAADYRALPELGVSCVSVATPTSSHFEIASWLLQNGIDVLVEKPMTRSLEEAEELRRIAVEHGRILQVGHVERFNSVFQEAQKRLTQPCFCEAQRVSPFRERSQDISVISDLMIHDLDIVLHLFSKKVERVEALGIPVVTPHADIANARLTFEDGAVAELTASRVAFKTERKIRFFQPDTYVSLDLANKKMRLVRLPQEPPLSIAKVRPESFAIRHGDALSDEVASFLKCVRERSKPMVSADDGLEALRVAAWIEREVAESVERHRGWKQARSESHK